MDIQSCLNQLKKTVSYGNFKNLNECLNILQAHNVKIDYMSLEFIITLNTGYVIKFDCGDNVLLKQQLEDFCIFKYYINNQLLQDLIYEMHPRYNSNLLQPFSLHSTDYFVTLDKMEDNFKQELLNTIKWLNEISIDVSNMRPCNEYSIFVTNEIYLTFQLVFDCEEKLKETLLYINFLKPYIDKMLFMEKIK